MSKQRYVAPKFVAEKRFDVSCCPDKGKEEFCDGNVNKGYCPIKYAFFGLVATEGGKKYAEVRDTGNSCPDYVEWLIPWKGKQERIGIVAGGVLPGLKDKGKGPCLYQTMKSTNPELLDVLDDLFHLVPKGSGQITKYLEKNLHAPKDVRERALKIADAPKPMKPKYKISERQMPK